MEGVFKWVLIGLIPAFMWLVWVMIKIFKGGRRVQDLGIGDNYKK